LRFAEELGDEENLPLPDAPVTPLPPSQLKVFRFDVLSVRPGNNGNAPGQATAFDPDDPIGPGGEVKGILRGRNLRNLSLDFGDGVELSKITYHPSGDRAEVSLKIDPDAEAGPRTLRVKDGCNRVVEIEEAFTIDGPPPEPDEDPLTAEFTPRCGYQGQRKCITFAGNNLAGAGVKFGAGIRVQSTKYSAANDEMKVDIEIDRLAEPGPRDVTLFMADCRSVVLDDKFIVERAAGSPPARFILAAEPKLKASECDPGTPGTDDDDDDGDDDDDDGPDDPALPPSSGSGGSLHVPDASGSEMPTGTDEPPSQDPPDYLKEYIPESRIRPYRPHPWPEPYHLARRSTTEVPVLLNKGQSVKTAYLLSRSSPRNLIPLKGRKQAGRRVTMTFDTAEAAPGEYELVKIMSDNSVEHVPLAVVLKV
jgi:hypothetical protein